MGDPEDLEAFPRDHGGLEGLARELGQYDPRLILHEDVANENEPHKRVGLWQLLLSRLGFNPGSHDAALEEARGQLHCSNKSKTTHR